MLKILKIKEESSPATQPNQDSSRVPILNDLGILRSGKMPGFSQICGTTKDKLVHALKNSSLKPTEEQLPSKKLQLLKLRSTDKLGKNEGGSKRGLGIESMWDYIESKADVLRDSSNSILNDTTESQIDGLYFKLENNQTPRLPN